MTRSAVILLAVVATGLFGCVSAPRPRAPVEPIPDDWAANASALEITLAKGASAASLMGL